jgi:hypothetical protein
MKTTASFRAQIQHRIAADEISEAIQLLQDLLKDSPKLNEVLLQSGRLSAISQQVRLGMVDNKQADLTKNQIRAGILELLDEIEAQGKQSPALQEAVEQFAAGITINQNAEKIYNIDKIDNANFS